MSAYRLSVGQTFLSAGSGDFPIASFHLRDLPSSNTALESAVNRQAGKPALQGLS